MRFCVTFTVLLGLAAQFAESFINRGDMLYNVQMDVFSGNKNPSWVVSRRNPMYRMINYAIGRARPTRMGSKLGYRGFEVEIRNRFGQRLYRTIGAGTHPRLEYALLNSSPSEMTSSVRRHVIELLNDRPGFYRSFNARVPIFGGSENNNDQGPRILYCRPPRYDPQNWNFQPVQRRNNCYNYATQTRTNTFAQPGRATGRPHTRPISTRSVHSATVRDGFIPIPFVNPRQCTIALVIWPGVDFHFYRLDSDGTWSHKPGRTRARRTDNSDNIIQDPRTADRGQYTVFAGFLANHRDARVR